VKTNTVTSKYDTYHKIGSRIFDSVRHPSGLHPPGIALLCLKSCALLHTSLPETAHHAQHPSLLRCGFRTSKLTKHLARIMNHCPLTNPQPYQRSRCGNGYWGHLRNRVKCCSEEGHVDSERVAACPPPPCSADYSLCLSGDCPDPRVAKYNTQAMKVGMFIRSAMNSSPRPMLALPLERPSSAIEQTMKETNARTNRLPGKIVRAIAIFFFMTFLS